MNIYTRTGDKGKTGLFDKKRVFKDDIRIESYGTIDELISFLGLAKNHVDCQELHALIEKLQSQLSIVAANLATKDGRNIKHRIREEDVGFLEDSIDQYMDSLDNPTGFILPGSGKEAAHLHICRTICRRAERRMVSLGRQSELDPLLMEYINRLSDLLYALARFLEDGEVELKYR